MGYNTPTNASFGGQYPVRVNEETLTVATGATTATATSRQKYKGTIEKVEIIPGTQMATSATLKAYEANTDMTTPDYFLNYTFPESEAQLTLYPLKPCVNVAGDNTTTTVSYADGYPICTKFVVCDTLKYDLASAVAGDSVTIRTYVRG